jgi:hypothetical protein
VSRRGQATLDVSQWPRVYVTWPAEAMEDDAFESIVLQMSALLKRGERYVIIHDARRAVRPTPKQRAFAAARQKHDAEGTRRFLAGVALAVSSPLTASVVTAINWIAPPPYPLKTFSAMAPAEAWATERLSVAAAAGKQAKDD